MVVLSTPPSRTSLPNQHDPKDNNNSNSSKFSVNVIVFCSFLLGVGILLGYSVFYVIFRNKCADLLVGKERTHNSSLVKLETKYSRALTEIEQCQQNSEAREKTKELEGRLVAQAALSDKHQELLARHEKTLEKISELQLTSETSQTQISVLKNEIKTVQLSLTESVEQLNQAKLERDEIQQQFHQHMAEADETIQQRQQENMELREVLDSCDDKIKNTEGKYAELKNLVQQNQYAQIIAM